MYLHVKPEIPENESILLLDVDDLAIAKVGTWPWGRYVMGDGLILMKEFDAAYSVFDIEYTERSPLGVNSELLEKEIPEVFADEFANINDNIGALFGALASGAISVQDAQDFVQDLIGLTDQSRQILIEKVNEVARDNDEYLGRAAHFFENAFFTVNMLPEEDPDVTEEVEEFAYENLTIDNMTVNGTLPESAEDVRPAVLPIISRAGGAGFPNIIIDSDGVRRRVNLFTRYKDRYFGQLAFAPLLDWLGNPDVIVEENSIVLRNAIHPDEGRRDITIPLNQEGRFLINWPKKEFEESFRHLSYWYLVLHKRQEDRIIENLSTMEDAGYLSYYQGDGNLLDGYRHAENIRQDILEGDSPDQVDGYRQGRAYFFDELGGFLKGDAKDTILAEVDGLLSSEELPEEYRETYMEVRRDVVDYFDNTLEIYESLMQTRETLAANLPGSFCIIGWTGTSTTDRGVNPFDSSYDNVGTHASVINTVLAGMFLDDLPWWYSAIIAFIAAFVVYFIIRGLNPGASLIIGAAFIIVILGGGVGYFLLTGTYLHILNPLLSVGVTFLVLTVVKFLQTAREKTFIRSAFGHYLSGDVINELLNDPEKLSLGGDKKNLTAIFTDIKGFSSISEVLDPSDLVHLLNLYLTEMSDSLMDLGATIDKYEGDAIISFFGAPVEFPDHAHRACDAAIRMKKAEAVLNKKLLEEKLTPNPLLTRIGINTGEMVVGNMGTAQKMDYTIMGNAVNLAARLEGVNKQYGTWVLMSETTYFQGGKDFVTRELDRVRVVGIQKPVRLYELVDTKEGIDDRTMEGVEEFRKALALFDKKEWQEALKGFEKALDIIPDDGPSVTFMKRCKEYIRKPPAASWDGVFNLNMK